MIPRILGFQIGEAAEKMPVIAVTGPRQSGKSTLVKQLFPKHVYINLEDIEQRKFARDDPKGFLQNLGRKAILDEVQNVPDLLSYIQVVVDKEKCRGNSLYQVRKTCCSWKVFRKALLAGSQYLTCSLFRWRNYKIPNLSFFQS